MQAVTDPLASHIDPAWPPMRHVRRGADRLGDEGRQVVADRLASTLATFEAPAEHRVALRRFFSFLAQVEVIAIEVPLSALPTAEPDLVPLFERQLADEVFHATVFAALAKRLGGLDTPIPEAETLLDRIRAQRDPKTTAVLLNLLAEGWIENLFDHAVEWGVADDVFRIVLEDEARHVEEAHAHADGVDLAHVQEAVRDFEMELFRLVQHPRVVLPTLSIAGEANFRKLSESFLRVHKDALAEVGLEMPDAIARLEDALSGYADQAGGLKRPREVAVESQWRRTAMELWDAPRNPVMHGWFDARIDHIPRHLLTAVVVAAVGKVWHDYPRMNRYLLGTRTFEPTGAHVGVRVGIGDHGEALSTVVVPDADVRSVDDIRRILDAAVARLDEMGAVIGAVRAAEGGEPLREVLRDEELMAMLPPESVVSAVTVSNVGRAGLVAGVGAMPGALGQSVEFIIGEAQDRPAWTGWRYRPAPSVTIGASADHRVIDGPHAAEGMRRLREALSPESVEEILARPDTLDPERPLESLTGITPAGGSALLLSSKAPFWLGWLCWLFKK